MKVTKQGHLIVYLEKNNNIVSLNTSGRNDKTTMSPRKFLYVLVAYLSIHLYINSVDLF